MSGTLTHESLQGQVVLITAGAGGIGRKMAEGFIENGCRVHVCDMSQEALDSFLAEFPNAVGHLADVADATQVSALFSALREQESHLDVLVNNAGMAGPAVPVEDLAPVDWDRTLAVNLNGQFYAAREAIPMMKPRKQGVIINMCSTAALFGCPLRAAYAASKWGVMGLTKTLAMELGEWGIRVNAICPSSVAGERIDRVIQRDARERQISEEEVRRQYQNQTSLRRFVTAEEVANMALFLASGLCTAISGQAMTVDGHTETLAQLKD